MQHRRQVATGSQVSRHPAPTCFYAHMVFLSEDDLFVEAQNPCVSCDVPIRLLGLAGFDTFAYIFDYGDYHVFRITSSTSGPPRVRSPHPTVILNTVSARTPT